MPHGDIGTVKCGDLKTYLKGGVHTHRRKLFHITLDLSTFHLEQKIATILQPVAPFSTWFLL